MSFQAEVASAFPQRYIRSVTRPLRRGHDTYASISLPLSIGLLVPTIFHGPISIPDSYLLLCSLYWGGCVGAILAAAAGEGSDVVMTSTRHG